MNKKFQFISSCAWHKRFIVDIAEELSNRGFEIRYSYGDNFTVENDWYTISTYHEDLSRLKDTKMVFFTEHAISFVKSAYASPQISLADYVLVQGKIFSQWLKFNHPNVKQLQTGWARIEQLYNKKSTRDFLIKEYNLNPDKPIIIYQPTWDSPAKRKQCGTIEEVYPLLKGMNILNLLIIPHPSDIYANGIFKNEKNIVRNVDIYNYLLGCDLLIGDTSSSLIEFTVLNKPIIHIDKWGNFEGLKNWYALNTNSEQFIDLFGFFQLGEIIPVNKQVIQNTIEDSLKNPDRYSKHREYWKKLALYNLGNSIKTVVDGILSVT